MTLPELPLAPLAKLLDLVAVWNARTDLTAARDPAALVDLYLPDALVLAAGASGHWVDVGSGGGAPALTLALLSPELSLTLVEPRDRRVAFLRTAVGELRLSRVNVRRARSDALDSASFDVAVSRATLSPEEWLAEGARLATSAVWVLLARGAAPALDGFAVDRELAYSWPASGAPRRALRYVRATS